MCWSASLQTGFHRADQFGLGTLIGRSTGEAFTMSFSGRGFVVVQPSEEVPGSFVSGTGGGQQAGSAGSAVGAVLGNFARRAMHTWMEQISAWSTEAPCGPS